MSDHCISIVPKISTYPNKETKIKEVLDWLISLDVTKPTISDSVLGENGGYAVSDAAKLTTTEPDYLPIAYSVNGLEIITERQIFDTGQNGMDELICPHCKKNIAEEDWIFLQEWADGDNNNITCPLCDSATDIHQFIFTPDWGFSDLGFRFWNWPGFTEKFIENFKQMLECDVNIVYTWI